MTRIFKLGLRKGKGIDMFVWTVYLQGKLMVKIPKKAPQNIKKRPQVKTRKWVRKKNGLFGWVTSVASQGSGKEPHNFWGVGDTNKSENTEQGKGREDGESAAGQTWSGQ